MKCISSTIFPPFAPHSYLPARSTPHLFLLQKGAGLLKQNQTEQDTIGQGKRPHIKIGQDNSRREKKCLKSCACHYILCEPVSSA